MNVKQGDMAILINSANGKAVGKICEVLRPIPGGRWQCRFQTPIEKVNGEFSAIAHAKDEWLRPVSGLPLEECERHAEKEPA